MKTYTICGSMRFEKEMRAAAYRLETTMGVNVLQCIYCPEEYTPNADELRLLQAAHRRKIEMSDGIYVVNPGGYIGASVREEIALALSMGKEVVYQNP